MEKANREGRERDGYSERGIYFYHLFFLFSVFFFFFGGFVIEECVFVLHHRLYSKKTERGKKSRGDFDNHSNSSLSQSHQGQLPAILALSRAKTHLSHFNHRLLSRNLTKSHLYNERFQDLFSTRETLVLLLSSSVAKGTICIYLRSSDCTVVRCFY